MPLNDRRVGTWVGRIAKTVGISAIIFVLMFAVVWSIDPRHLTIDSEQTQSVAHSQEQIRAALARLSQSTP